MGLPCLFKRKGASSRCFVHARAHVRALMTQKSCALGMSKAKLGNHCKLVETFLIVVVSQNVFSTEIDNPFFYKVFQLAPGGGGFAKNFCPGGWWNSP